MARCSICKKRAKSGSNVSHAQNRTKRKFRPNIQKVNGVILCSKCIKTIKKINREEMAKEAQAKEKKAVVKGVEETRVEEKPKKEAKKTKKVAEKKAPAKKATKTEKK